MDEWTREQVAAALVADGAGTLPEGVAYAAGAGGAGGRALPPGVTPLEAYLRGRMINLPVPARL